MKDSPLFLLAELSGAWVTMSIKDTGEFIFISVSFPWPFMCLCFFQLVIF